MQNSDTRQSAVLAITLSLGALLVTSMFYHGWDSWTLLHRAQDLLLLR